MIDIRQSPEYAKHLELLGWKIEKIDGCYIFIRKFPLLGSFIKIQRPEKLPPIEKIFLMVKKYHARQVILELVKPFSYSAIQLFLNHGFRPSSPFLPSKTLYIDLTRSEDKIFTNFSASKRRDIRRAIRDNVVVKESKKIDDFVVLKNAQHGFSGRILPVDKQFKALWQAFWPKKAVLLLAYRKPTNRNVVMHFSASSVSGCDESHHYTSIGGLLLLFHNRTAYYFQAASTKQGNKLAAPSLLVWEALKLAKQRGCKVFDFEGIYDPRFPQKSWLGFTKFKKGFGGKEIVYPQPLVKTFWRLI